MCKLSKCVLHGDASRVKREIDQWAHFFVSSQKHNENSVHCITGKSLTLNSNQLVCGAEHVHSQINQRSSQSHTRAKKKKKKNL